MAHQFAILRKTGDLRLTQFLPIQQIKTMASSTADLFIKNGFMNTSAATYFANKGLLEDTLDADDFEQYYQKEDSSVHKFCCTHLDKLIPHLYCKKMELESLLIDPEVVHRRCIRFIRRNEKVSEMIAQDPKLLEIFFSIDGDQAVVKSCCSSDNHIAKWFDLAVHLIQKFPRQVVQMMSDTPTIFEKLINQLFNVQGMDDIIFRILGLHTFSFVELGGDSNSEKVKLAKDSNKPELSDEYERLLFQAIQKTRKGRYFMEINRSWTKANIAQKIIHQIHQNQVSYQQVIPFVRKLAELELHIATLQPDNNKYDLPYVIDFIAEAMEVENFFRFDYFLKDPESAVQWRLQYEWAIMLSVLVKHCSTLNKKPVHVINFLQHITEQLPKMTEWLIQPTPSKLALIDMVIAITGTGNEDILVSLIKGKTPQAILIVGIENKTSSILHGKCVKLCKHILQDERLTKRVFLKTQVFPKFCQLVIEDNGKKSIERIHHAPFANVIVQMIVAKFKELKYDFELVMKKVKADENIWERTMETDCYSEFVSLRKQWKEEKQKTKLFEFIVSMWEKRQ